MIIMKFGGTSVGNAEAILHVTEIIRDHRHLQPVVVVSAMSKVTDALRHIAREACQGNQAQALIDELRIRHIATAEALLGSTERDVMIATFTGMFEELASICHGITLLRELTHRTIDLVSSFGERLSAPLVSSVLQAHGVASDAVDTREYIQTNEKHTEAEVDFIETNRRLVEGFLPIVESGRVPVVTGFIGSTPQGVTTTLGRGASDYTASIIASALKAEEIWIWTDVDGAMTADPRIVQEARVIKKISYREASEMSYFGAKVLHPKTMLPAVKDKIPIRIKNTFNPSESGTLISDTTILSPMGVKMVTSMGRLCLVMIEGSGLISMPDTPARVFQTTAAHQVNVIMITQASSEHDICLVIDERDRHRVVSSLQKEFRHEVEVGSLDAITVQSHVAVIAVVGEGMKGTPGVAARTFGILSEKQINIIAIAQGSSELNISFVVDHADLDNAVQFVHSAFGLDSLT